MPRKADPILNHFQGCLVTKQRQDGNAIPTVAKGDCCILLQLIRMKLDNFQSKIDPANPGRFRGTTVLMQDMKDVLGDVPRLHVPKWGASHVRGALRDDLRRGNKRHLIQMIELLNAYASAPTDLQRAYHDCIRAHHTYWESFSIVVTFQSDDPVQAKVLQLLAIPSLGRVQQGLVFSTLYRRYGKVHRVTTKKTFAGDDQSSRGEVVQRGDVQVWRASQMLLAVEVKDAIIDEVGWGRVSSTHGKHDYPLFVLGIGFSPPKIQQTISSQSLTFALHLADFVLSTMALSSIDEGVPLQAVLSQVLEIYNSVFCDQVENDPSIRISISEK